jgi:hypothetical protein
MIRSRAEWREKGERCTKYFANLEKSRSQQTLIRAVKREDGSVTHNVNQILEEHRQFYSKLYTQEPTDTLKQDVTLDKFEKLVSQNTLMRPVSQGGLNLVDLSFKLKALQVQWIRRFLS